MLEILDICLILLTVALSTVALASAVAFVYLLIRILLKEIQ